MDDNILSTSADETADNPLEMCRSPQTVGWLGLRHCRPHLLLADVVEDIWDWALADPDAASRLTLKFPPSSFPLLVFQYGAPLGCEWEFGPDSRRSPPMRHAAVKLQTGIVSVRATGPIGTIVVRLKPETADRVMHAPIRDFIDNTVDLRNLYKPKLMALLEESLFKAPDSAARIRLMEEFLFRVMRPLRPRSLLAQAASRLRFNPSLAIGRLAAQLGVSERHLSRGFKSVFGTGPKQFARVVRVEKAVAARRAGFNWSDVANACGFSDQAHLIHDFNAITGASPEDIFRTSLAGPAFPGIRRSPFSVFIS